MGLEVKTFLPGQSTAHESAVLAIGTAIPKEAMVPHEFMVSMDHAYEAPGCHHSIARYFESSSDIAWNRNGIVGAFLRENKCSHLLFVDSDHVFTPNQIQRLLDDDRDIVSGLYVRRSFPPPFVAGFFGWAYNENRKAIVKSSIYGDGDVWDDRVFPFEPEEEIVRKTMEGRDKQERILRQIEALKPTDPSQNGGDPQGHDEETHKLHMELAHACREMPIETVGFGFILIKRGVFDKIGADKVKSGEWDNPTQGPWFLQHWSVWGKEHNGVSEDGYFCWLAQQHGFRVYVDGRVQVGHVGQYIYSFEDFKQYAAQRAMVNANQ